MLKIRVQYTKERELHDFITGLKGQIVNIRYPRQEAGQYKRAYLLVEFRSNLKDS